MHSTWLVELSRSLDNVPIYGLNLRDERAAAIDWLARDGNPYAEIAFDQDGAVSIDWGVYGAPETFVIDAEGIIRFKHVGILTDAIVRERILPLIEQLRSAPVSMEKGK